MNLPLVTLLGGVRDSMIDAAVNSDREVPLIPPS
jgi:hypothetical protein